MREDWIQPKLDDTKLRGLERAARVYPEAGGVIKINGKEMLNFSSNDYLDLARDDRLAAAARAALEVGSGAGASRLVSGSLPLHEELEQRLAEPVGFPSRGRRSGERCGGRR